MLLSGIYTLLGVPLPPLYFFLSSLIYLTGGLLGGMWSKGSFHRSGFSRADGIVACFVLMMSVGFLLLGIIFVFIGFQRVASLCKYLSAQYARFVCVTARRNLVLYHQSWNL